VASQLQQLLAWTITARLEDTDKFVPTEYDAIIVGSGPNGLAAAIELARAGKSVCIYEANNTIGGAASSGELTLPGFIHDLCSAVHPLAASSPFFTTVPLEQHGLEFIYPPASLAHPFDDGSALLLERSIELTSAGLGEDRRSYQKLFAPLVTHWNQFAVELLGPPRFPKFPFRAARFGWYAIRSANRLANSLFRRDKTRAVFAGLAAHSCLSLEQAGSAAFGLVLATMAHAIGWPIAKGGSQNISNVLAAYLRELGGEIVINHPVVTLEALPSSRVILCDVTPSQLIVLAGQSLPGGFRRSLARYRYGPGVFKMDWALSSPVPWTATECAQAATVHLGGSFEEILSSERMVSKGQHPDRPFIILSQPTLFDPSRAPQGQHTLWAYCHVPNGSWLDMSEQIESQIERFAPGFRDCVLARSVRPPQALEKHNSNLIGGDINGGLQNLSQLFTRPTWRMYATPRKNIYLCSSSTPPGGGVHGMCGYHAASLAIRRVFPSDLGTQRALIRDSRLGGT